MVANNAGWAPSSTPGEAKGNTPAVAPTKTTPGTPEKPFTGKPVGVQWDQSKESPVAKKASVPVTEADAPEDMTPAQKKIWKIKVNGKERDYDASDEAELKRMVEKAYGADEVFQKAATTSKQAEQFYGMLKEAAGDPNKLAALLKHEQLGGDFEKLAEQFLWKKIQDEKMTPEQKEDRRIKEELQRYKDQEAAAKAKSEADDHEKLVATIQTSFSSGIEAAHKAVGLPTNPYSIYRVAEYARDSVERGVEPDFTAISQRVKQDYVDEFKHFFENADEGQLAALGSEKVLKRLRQFDVDRLKSTTAEKFHTQAKPRAKAAPGERQPPKLDGADWRAKLIRERS